MLVLFKLLHTVVWAFFVACICGIFVAAHAGRFLWAFGLIGTVLIEVFVLIAHRLRCPRASVAARYTEERGANFDIFLPVSIAKYNKEILGPLFALGVAYTLVRWFA